MHLTAMLVATWREQQQRKMEQVLCSVNTTLSESCLEASLLWTPHSTGSCNTADIHTRVSAENLHRKWWIGLHVAEKALQVTTQQGIQT